MVVRGVPSFAMAMVSLLLCLPLPSYPSMTPSSLETCKKKPDVGTGPCSTLSAVRGLLPGHKDSVNCITMNDHGNMLLSGSDDGTARAWDLRTLQCVASFAARHSASSHLLPVSSVATTSHRDHMIYLAAGSCVLEYDTRMPAQHCVETIIQQPHASAVHAVAASVDITQIAVNHAGSQLAAVDEGGRVTVLDLLRPSLRVMPGVHHGLATCLTWRTHMEPWHHQLVTGGTDMRVLMHDTLGNKLLHDMSAAPSDNDPLAALNPPFVHAIDASVDGRWLAVGAGDGVLRVYDMMDAKLRDKFDRRGAHRRGITCVAFPKESPPYRCVSAGDDARIKVWNLAEPVLSDDEDPVIIDIHHKVKPNWVYCRSFGTGGAAPHLFVADVSNTISTYTFRS